MYVRVSFIFIVVFIWLGQTFNFMGLWIKVNVLLPEFQNFSNTIIYFHILFNFHVSFQFWINKYGCQRPLTYRLYVSSILILDSIWLHLVFITFPDYIRLYWILNWPHNFVPNGPPNFKFISRVVSILYRLGWFCSQGLL